MPQVFTLKTIPFINKGNGLVRDKNEKEYRSQEVDFHVKSNDYFGTLATILDLMSQEKKHLHKRHAKIIQSMKKNLIYLQKHYKIVKKKN